MFRHSVHMRRIVTWFDKRYSIFPYYLLNGTIFKKVSEHKMCILTSSKKVPEKFVILEELIYI